MEGRGRALKIRDFVLRNIEIALNIIIFFEVAGYVNTFKNFSYAIVRDGGHILPADQPKWTLDMVNRFIKGIPFDK